MVTVGLLTHFGLIYRIYPLNGVVEGCYIGQTRNAMSKRWKQHLCSSRHELSYIGCIIKRYGKLNFAILTIAFALSLDLLNLLLKKYIAIYDSFHNGFNRTPGGSYTKSCGLGKAVIHYLTGILYRNSQRASLQTGILASDIRAIANKKIKSSKGQHFYWAWRNVSEYLLYWQSKDKTGPKRVINLLTGLIFSSQLLAARRYGLTKTQISCMCRGKSAALRYRKEVLFVFLSTTKLLRLKRLKEFLEYINTRFKDHSYNKKLLDKKTGILYKSYRLAAFNMHMPIAKLAGRIGVLRKKGLMLNLDIKLF